MRAWLCSRRSAASGVSGSGGRRGQRRREGGAAPAPPDMAARRCCRVPEPRKPAASRPWPRFRSLGARPSSPLASLLSVRLTINPGEPHTAVRHAGRAISSGCWRPAACRSGSGSRGGIQVLNAVLHVLLQLLLPPSVENVMYSLSSSIERTRGMAHQHSSRLRQPTRLGCVAQETHQAGVLAPRNFPLSGSQEV